MLWLLPFLDMDLNHSLRVSISLLFEENISTGRESAVDPVLLEGWGDLKKNNRSINMVPVVWNLRVPIILHKPPSQKPQQHKDQDRIRPARDRVDQIQTHRHK